MFSRHFHIHRNTLSVALLGVLLVVSAGCEGRGLSRRESGALAGGALGAGLGAIVGNQVGSSGAGIAIGAAIGAASGALMGNSLDNSHDAMDETDRTLERQERELEENRRLIQQLKSRGADVRETSRGVVVNLPDVLFEFDSARLAGSARSTVRDIAEVAAQAGGRTISVEGHTDSVGTSEYNQRLSENRARAVAAELTAQGVPRSRLKTRGYGEGDPIASNRTDSGRARNRRVEVIIENPAKVN